MTALVPPENFGNKHLIYLPKYIKPDSEEFTKSDDEIRATFIEGLRRLHPDLKDEEILAFQVARAKYVMPIPTLGYSESLPPRKTSVPGVFVVNGAQLVNSTLNVNEIIALAEGSVDEIVDSPQRKSTPHS